MHIPIGAAILILGILFLATSKAGLKVLGVLALVGVVGVGALVYREDQDGAGRKQQLCLKDYKTEAFRSACIHSP